MGYQQPMAKGSILKVAAWDCLCSVHVSHKEVGGPHHILQSRSSFQQLVVSRRHAVAGNVQDSGSSKFQMFSDDPGRVRNSDLWLVESLKLR